MTDTVTLATAVEAGPLVDVAVTVQFAAEVGAVKSPVTVSIDPQLADHLDGTLALNCSLPIAKREAAAGLMVTPENIVAVEKATWPLPSVAVAEMVHDSARDGAV